MNEPDSNPVKVAALFAAPEGPEGADMINAADPMHQLGEAERELARLRLMRIDDIIHEYLGTRDHLEEERHAWQAIESKLKGKLEMMSGVLMEKADSVGVDNFNVRGVATAYRNTKISYRILDWTEFSKWIAQTNNFQCLEKRVAKLATAEVESSTGNVPPGVDKITEVEFNVRRVKA